MATVKDKKKRIFLADKVSGLEGTAFALSVCIRVIELGNQRVKFKFPFWGFSVGRDNDHGTEWIQEKGYQAEAEKVLKFVSHQAGLDYFRNISRQIIFEEKSLEKEAAILRFRLADFNNQKLVKKYYEFIEKYSRSYGLGILTFLYEAILSEKLMQSLAVRSNQAALALPRLLKSRYQSFMLASETALLKIKHEQSLVRQTKLINNYLKKFFYIATSYKESPTIDEKYVRLRLKELSVRQTGREKTDRYSIKLLNWEKNLVRLLKINEIIRDKRKQVNTVGSYMMFRFFKEASRRQSIDLPLLDRAFWFEYREIFENKDGLINKLKKRTSFSFLLDRRLKKSFYFDYVALQEREGHSCGEKKVIGTPASAGVYRGVIRKVLGRKDFHFFKKGEILLTTMTRPDFLPIMSRAAAIITDEGGLTCHAAIVSRELRIPCIVGAKRATQIFATGDLVEVDANRGIVKIVKA